MPRPALLLVIFAGLAPVAMVWVRKTRKERARERNAPAQRLKSLLLAGFLGFALGVGVMSTGNLGSNGRVTGTGFLVAIVFGLVAMYGAHRARLRYGKPLFTRQHGQTQGKYLPVSTDRQICNRCGRMRFYDRQPDCECGGKFEDFEEWKWVRD
jgi:ribosomal protein L37E